MIRVRLWHPFICSNLFKMTRNGHSLLIFKEMRPNYAYGPSPVPNKDALGFSVYSLQIRPELSVTIQEITISGKKKKLRLWTPDFFLSRITLSIIMIFGTGYQI